MSPGQPVPRLLGSAATGPGPISADRCELRLSTKCCGFHDSLRGPVVDPRCLGGSVDRRAFTGCRQHCNGLVIDTPTLSGQSMDAALAGVEAHPAARRDDTFAVEPKRCFDHVAHTVAEREVAGRGLNGDRAGRRWRSGRRCAWDRRRRDGRRLLSNRRGREEDAKQGKGKAVHWKSRKTNR